MNHRKYFSLICIVSCVIFGSCSPLDDQSAERSYIGLSKIDYMANIEAIDQDGNKIHYLCYVVERGWLVPLKEPSYEDVVLGEKFETSRSKSLNRQIEEAYDGSSMKVSAKNHDREWFNAGAKALVAEAILNQDLKDLAKDWECNYGPKSKFLYKCGSLEVFPGGENGCDFDMEYDALDLFKGSPMKVKTATLFLEGKVYWSKVVEAEKVGDWSSSCGDGSIGSQVVPGQNPYDPTNYNQGYIQGGGYGLPSNPVGSPYRYEPSYGGGYRPSSDVSAPGIR